jgi:hypothetical protein
MKIGIMQPYFFSYIGYWQLINTVDKFVIYDNIQFTKKSWIRRNRILLNGKDKLFTLPIKKDSDYLDVSERYLSETFPKKREKLLNQIKMAYKKAPQFSTVFPIIEECINYNNDNLFEYIYHSIVKVLEYLDIDTEIIISSSIDIDHSLQNKYRVIETCKVLGGDTYINPIGGMELYDKEEFSQNGIELKFLQTDNFKYKQYDNSFVPNLSIIDVMMFNSIEEVKKMLEKYELL